MQFNRLENDGRPQIMLDKLSIWSAYMIWLNNVENHTQIMLKFKRYDILNDL